MASNNRGLPKAVTLEIVCGVGDWPVRLLIGMPKEDHRDATLKENSAEDHPEMASLAVERHYLHAAHKALKAEEAAAKAKAKAETEAKAAAAALADAAAAKLEAAAALELATKAEEEASRVAVAVTAAAIQRGMAEAGVAAEAEVANAAAVVDPFDGSSPSAGAIEPHEKTRSDSHSPLAAPREASLDAAITETAALPKRKTKPKAAQSKGKAKPKAAQTKPMRNKGVPTPGVVRSAVVLPCVVLAFVVLAGVLHSTFLHSAGTSKLLESCQRDEAPYMVGNLREADQRTTNDALLATIAASAEATVSRTAIAPRGTSFDYVATPFAIHQHDPAACSVSPEPNGSRVAGRNRVSENNEIATVVATTPTPEVPDVECPVRWSELPWLDAKDALATRQQGNDTVPSSMQNTSSDSRTIAGSGSAPDAARATTSPTSGPLTAAQDRERDSARQSGAPTVRQVHEHMRRARILLKLDQAPPSITQSTAVRVPAAEQEQEKAATSEEDAASRETVWRRQLQDQIACVLALALDFGLLCWLLSGYRTRRPAQREPEKTPAFVQSSMPPELRLVLTLTLFLIIMVPCARGAVTAQSRPAEDEPIGNSKLTHVTVAEAASSPSPDPNIVLSAGASLVVLDPTEPASAAALDSPPSGLAHPSMRRLATTTVSPGAGTLQAAHDAATAGDVLELADGTYTGSGNYTGIAPVNTNALLISKDITIRAKNAGQAVLDGENVQRMIKITGGTVMLEGLKITKGKVSFALDGGGVLIQGSSTSVTFQSCQIYSNIAGAGGGVYIGDGTVTLNNCEIYSNNPWYLGGGVYIADGTVTGGSGTSVTLNNCQIYSNTVDNRGFFGSTSNSDGGGVFIGGGTATLNSCGIYSNTVNDDGGGVYIDGGTVTLTSCKIYSNAAVYGGGDEGAEGGRGTDVEAEGGGVYISGGTATLVLTRIYDNTAGAGAGANIFPAAGTLYYALPAPPGYWVPNSDCVANREPCETWNTACRAAPCSTTAGTSANGWTPTNCKAPIFIQPCNWQIAACASSPPAADCPLGKKIYFVPYFPVEEDFPYKCPAGYLGSNESAYQISSDCAGKCPAGTYQPKIGQTACNDCPSGHYCPEGSTTPLPCAGGTASSITKLGSASGCTPVLPGYWAPLGSSAPIKCPDSGFYCPGKALDEVSGGSLPIQVSMGGASETRQVESVQKEMTLDVSCASFDMDKVKQSLAEQYKVDVAQITLSNPCARRQRQLQSSPSITFTMYVATTGTSADGTALSTPVADLLAAVQNVDDAALGSSIGSVLGVSVSVSSQTPTQGVVTQTVSFTCPKGKWCTAGLVVDCTSGTYNPLEGQEVGTACLACPEFSTSPAASTAVSDCVCEAGFVQTIDATGAPKCECAIGYEIMNGISCQACGLGTYKASAGNTKCTECPYDDSTTASVGAKSDLDCVCALGYFNAKSNGAAGGPSCSSCKTALDGAADGALCDESGVELASLPISTGHWRAYNGSAHLWRCLSAGACLGGNATCDDPFCATGGTGSASSGFAGSCAAGHTGPFCDNCLAGHYKASGVCLECAGDGGQLLLLLLPTLILLGVLSFCLVFVCRSGKLRQKIKEKTRAKAEETAMEGTDNSALSAGAGNDGGKKKKSLLSTVDKRKLVKLSNLLSGWQVDFKILVSLIQVTGALSLTFSVSYPPIYSGLLRWLSVLKLDIVEVMPLSCYGVGFSFHSSLLLRTLFPLALLAVALGWSLAFRERKESALATIGDRLLTTTFFIVFLVYPTTSQMVFSSFNCVNFDDPAQTRALRQDLTIDCDSPGHVTMQIYSVIMIFIYPIGVPLLYVYLLTVRCGPTLNLMKKNEELRVSLRAEAVADIMLARRAAARAREEGLTIQEQVPPADAELPATVVARIADLDKEKTALHASLPDYIKRLVSGYRAVRYEFEVFECVRKLAVVCMPVFLPPGSNAQLIFGQMVCFVTFGFYAMMAPFAESRANSFAQLCQVQIFFALLSSTALRDDGAVARDNLDLLLTILTLATLGTTLVLRTPLERLLDFGERIRFRRGLAKLCRRCCGCRGRRKAVQRQLMATAGSPVGGATEVVQVAMAETAAEPFQSEAAAPPSPAKAASIEASKVPVPPTFPPLAPSEAVATEPPPTVASTGAGTIAGPKGGGGGIFAMFTPQASPTAQEDADAKNADAAGAAGATANEDLRA